MGGKKDRKRETLRQRWLLSHEYEYLTEEMFDVRLLPKELTWISLMIILYISVLVGVDLGSQPKF